jgi:predicted esterase
VRVLILCLIFATLAAACGGDSDEPAALPSVEPGESAVGVVDIDGVAIDYVTAVPDGFSLGDPAPVMLALPPGGQGLDLTRSVLDGTYLPEAIARGWVVVSPAAPDGELFFNGSETLIPGFIEWISTWVDVESDTPHLVGVSNGGISAFRVATADPGSVQSLLVFPGFPRGDDDRAALTNLGDLPVRMFVGESDTGWVEPMQDALDALLAAGSDVTLEIVPGEGHIIGTLRDGRRIFDELDALR